MSARPCINCGEPVPDRSRADRLTCSMRCHVAAWRARRSADLAAGGAKAHEPVRLRAEPVVVVTSPILSNPEVATQLALWLADVAVEAATQNEAA